MAEMGALRDDLHAFCEQYGSLDEATRAPVDKAGAIHSLFLGLATASKMTADAVDRFGTWSHSATSRLCRLDDLVDDHRLRPSVARSILFDPSSDHDAAFAHAMGLPRESVARVLDGQGNERQLLAFEARSGLRPDDYAGMRYVASFAAMYEQDHVEAMGLDYLDFYLLQESSLERMEETFRLEKRHRDGERIDEAGVAAMILRQTQALMFVCEVLGRAMHADGIGSPVIRAVQDFLHDYGQLCVGLDQLADVEEDALSGRFNVVLCRHAAIVGPQTRIESRGLWEDLARSGALAEAVRLLEALSEHARWTVASIAHPGLRAFFSHLAGGVQEALRILARYDQLIDIPDSKRRAAKLLLLKPSPWEALTFEQVFPP